MINQQKKHTYTALIIIILSFIFAGIWSHFQYNKRNNVKVEKIEEDILHYSDHITKEIVVLKGQNLEAKILWPKIANINDEILLQQLSQEVGYNKIAGETIETTKQQYSECECGIVGADYAINYDKNDLFSLTISIKHMGAYPSDQKEYINMLLKEGRRLDMQDIINPDEIKKVAELCDNKLQKNIENAIKLADNEGWDVPELFSEYSCTAKDLSKFTLHQDKIAIHYEFGFPRAIEAAEPLSTIYLGYEELGSSLTIPL